MELLGEKVDILGVKIDAVNLILACQKINHWIKERRKVYICVAPVSTIVECRRDQVYGKIINEADMVTPDGMPLVWLGRLRGHKDMQRTYGPDLMLALCQEAGLKHFLYGASEVVLERLQEKLKEYFPSVNIVGHHAPTFSQEVAVESPEIIDRINASQADIVWVALGSPKQDFWMHRHRGRLNAPVMIGVGAAFDFLAGVKPQAPRWVQRIGMEWFFRLCCEPKRLWKRYLIGNTQFLYCLLQDQVRRLTRQPNGKNE